MCQYGCFADPQLGNCHLCGNILQHTNGVSIRDGRLMTAGCACCDMWYSCPHKDGRVQIHLSHRIKDTYGNVYIIFGPLRSDGPINTIHDQTNFNPPVKSTTTGFKDGC